jgi:hypothetical protein
LKPSAMNKTTGQVKSTRSKSFRHRHASNPTAASFAASHSSFADSKLNRLVHSNR